MRRLLMLGCVILFGIALPYTASSQIAAGGAPVKVAAILAQFPDGGPGLSDAIAAAVEMDPSLAPAVVAAALTATPAQQQAIGAGLAIAATFFANAAAGLCPDPQQQQLLLHLANPPPACPPPDIARKAEQLIQAAMASAPTLVLTAFAGGGGFLTLSTGFGVGATSFSTNSCISPSGPGGTCR